MNIQPKNTNVTISPLGEQRIFVSGNLNWRLEWAKLNDKTFTVGTKVKWVNNETGRMVKASKIEWLIIIDNGDVEVATDHPHWGRMSIEDLIFIK